MDTGNCQGNLGGERHCESKVSIMETGVKHKNSGSSGPGSSAGQGCLSLQGNTRGLHAGYCFVFLGKTVNSRSVSLHPGV